MRRPAGVRGALILVFDDRALLDAVGTRTIAVEDRALHSYEGGWPEYVRVREERAAEGPERGRATVVAPLARTPATVNGAAERAEAPKPSVQGQGPSKNRLSAQEQAEREVEQAEAALTALEDELADPAAWATRYEAAKSEARHTAAKRAVEAAYARLGELID